MDTVHVGQNAETVPRSTRLPEWFWPGMFIAANILLGIFIASRHGLSFDEPGTIIQGERTLQAYPRLARPADSYKDLGYYGPFYFALAEVGARLVVHLRSAWTLEQARHFFYFSTFQGSILAVYYLCRRVARRSVAQVGAVLFASQPLLFGHAIINSKDTPFLTFFLLAVASGVALAERLGSRGPSFEANRRCSRTDMAPGPVILTTRLVSARSDLRRWVSGSGVDGSSESPEYAVLATRSNVDLDTFPQARVVYTVGVDGAVLAVVRQVSDQSNVPQSP